MEHERMEKTTRLENSISQRGFHSLGNVPARVRSTSLRLPNRPWPYLPRRSMPVQTGASYDLQAEQQLADDLNRIIASQLRSDHSTQASERRPIPALTLYHRPKTTLCPRYTSTGSCFRGRDCANIHDSNKVAVCPSVLRRTKCFKRAACGLDHVLTSQTTPTCIFFLRGRCTHPTCQYIHTDIDPSASLCTDFAYLGYCEKGLTCTLRHLRECPAYTNEGHCKTSSCTLPHVDRASDMKRRLSDQTATPESMDVEDSSSGENVEDRTSDVGEGDFAFIGKYGQPVVGMEGVQFAQQHDFVAFT